MRTTPITAAEIMSWGTCPDWPEERVAAFVGEGMTPQQLLESEGLTDTEKAYLLDRPEVLSTTAMRSALRHCDAAVLDGEALASWPDPVGALVIARGVSEAAFLDGLRTWIAENAV